jgi:hypothetical protein
LLFVFCPPPSSLMMRLSLSLTTGTCPGCPEVSRSPMNESRDAYAWVGMGWGWQARMQTTLLHLAQVGPKGVHVMSPLLRLVLDSNGDSQDSPQHSGASREHLGLTKLLLHEAHIVI